MESDTVRARSDRKKPRLRPRRATVETLESRELLAAIPANPFVVTTTADSGSAPGSVSLRQAIASADAQSGSTPIVISFNLPTSDPGYNPQTATWTISVGSELPAMTRAGVTIDGTTQTTPVTPATVGIGGTVGVNALPLATLAAPSVQIVDAVPGALPIGLDVQAGQTTIHGLAIYGFGGVPNDNSAANIRVDTTASGTMIDGDVIGAASGAYAAGSQAAAGDDIRIIGSGPGTVQNCLVVSSQGKGVELDGGSDGWTVQGNEIRGNGYGSWNLDGIDIENGSGFETISGNLIAANWACGIDSYLSIGGNTIAGNTIADNGIGTFSYQETPGIRLYGTGSVVRSNIIEGNYGAGVLITSGSLQDTITQNSISGNGTILNLAGAGPSGEIGIDVLSPSDNVSQGTPPYVTPNTPDASRDGINGPANYPVFAGVQIQNGQLTFSGFARPGAVIELYLSDPSSTGFGQGRTYIGTFTEGSSADTDGGTGSYGPTSTGVAVGSDTTNRFRFSIPTPAGIVPGEVVTATATENGSTSEFGPLATIVGVSGPLTYQPTGPGPNAISLQTDSSSVEIVNNGTVVAREPVSLAASIQIQGFSNVADSLTVDESSPYAGGLSLSNLATTSILVAGDFSGQITAPTSTFIQSVVIEGSVTKDASITAGAFVPGVGQSPPAVLIQGNLAGTIDAIEQKTVPGSGVISSIEIDGSLLSTGLVLAGSIGSILVKKSFSGTVIASGAGTVGDVTVGGDLSGSLDADIDPNNPDTSGSIGMVSVGGSLSGTVSSGDISGVTITGDLSGATADDPDGGMILASESVTGDVTVGGALGDVSVGGSLAGSVSAGSISGIQVGLDFSGTVIASGAGTVGDVTVGGDLSGSLDADIDPNNPDTSGSIGMVTVMGSLSGTVSSGDISGVTITGDLSGATADDPDGGMILASESVTGANVTVGGVLGDVSVGGSLAGSVDAGSIPGSISVGLDLSGTVIAQGAGTIGDVTVGRDITPTGKLEALTDPSSKGSGAIASLTVKGNVAGSVVAPTQITAVMINSVSPGVKIATGAASTVEYGTIAAGSEFDAASITTLTIDHDVAGTINVSGNLQTLNVKNGSIAAGAIVDAGSLGSAYIGGNMAGQINVTGNLGSATVGGGTSGSFVAAQVGSISAGAGFGPVVLQVTEGGIQRLLEATSTSNSPSLAGVSFRYIYESHSLSGPAPIPQLTVQVLNQSGNTGADQFDLSLVVNSDTAKFNLARLDAGGVSGIRNVDVEGDILTSVTSLAKSTLGDSNPAGIYLPGDKLAGVAVRDFIPSGSITAYSIQAIAAGLIGRSGGQSVMGASASATDAQNLLAKGTKIVQAADTFLVPFANNPSSPLQVGFFFDNSTSGSFNWSDVAFSVQNDVTVSSDGKTPYVIPTDTHGSDVATITIKLSNGGSQIQGVGIVGDGASISTQQWINGPIASTGSLGDLSLLTSQPIGNITAASIFGTITSYGTIAGTIQTTVGDFGRVYLSGSKLTMTALAVNGGAFAGKIIVQGSLLTNLTFNGGLAKQSQIVAQGNIGAAYGSTRLGGVTINGGDGGVIQAQGSIVGDVTLNGGLSSGASILAGANIVGNTTVNGGDGGVILAVGQILGNVTLNGGLSSGASIAAGGNIVGNTTVNGSDGGTILSVGQVLGNLTINGGLSSGASIAAQGGILGNTTINGGIASGASIVSGGDIGSKAAGTKLTVNGTTNGLIASIGNLILTGNPSNSAHTFYNLGSPMDPNNTKAPSARAVDAIFSLGDFVTIQESLCDLQNITGELVALHIGKNKMLTIDPNG